MSGAATGDVATMPEPGAPPPRRRVVALLASHNRRALTLRALGALAAGNAVFDLSVVLFEDGSTDGTAEAVAAEFPETIVVRGTGDAYWNGGMYRAWRRALELAPDAYLWLNDDVLLDPDALARLAEAWPTADASGAGEAAILVGATRDATGTLTYGGMLRERSPFALRFRRLPIVDRTRRIDTFNGNIVLVTAATVARIGIIDPIFFHKFGDIDYGLRATAAGVPVLLLPGTVGVCEGALPFDLRALPLAARWRHYASHRGVPFGSWWRMTRRYSGIWAVPHFLLAYRRLLCPRASRRRRA